MENSVVCPNKEAVVSPLSPEPKEASTCSDTMDKTKAELSLYEATEMVSPIELIEIEPPREDTAPPSPPENFNTNGRLSSQEEESVSASTSDSPPGPLVPSDTVNEDKDNSCESKAHLEVVPLDVIPARAVAVVQVPVVSHHAEKNPPPRPPYAKNNSSTTESHEQETTVKPGIASLPIDSLHCIASFLTPAEWSNFGQTGRPANRVCREIVRRVRMHGFRCATEIVTAWKLGQHTDARELSALYIQAGVPVYPRSLGHSYHTLVWRMGVDVSTMQQAEQGTEPSLGQALPPRVDPFYTERSEFRTREGYNPHITYLEEKSVFWMCKHDLLNTAVQRSLFPFDHHTRRPLSPDAGRRPLIPGPNAVRGTAIQKSDTAAPPHDRAVPNLPKIPLKLHQHLYDQHMLGKVYVDDQDGTMVTPPVSLSADFFHPTAHSYPVVWSSTAANPMTGLKDETKREGLAHQVSMEEVTDGTAQLAIDVPTLTEVHEAGRVAQDPNVEPNVNIPEEDLETNEEETGGVDLEPPPPITAWRLESILKYLNLEIYTSSMAIIPKSDDVVDGSQEMKKHLRSRFATYQRRLEALLAQGDNVGFEESILDFWDEFFPHSAMIQYFDLYTAVPRISCLQKFLTRPCPKSIGTIQCEIERIKIPARGKGVSMKGRLFPTYEYRLFIRDRPPNSTAPESATVDEDNYTRRDTVLMVARNKGRKHVNASGAVPVPSSSKKGSNNYYLHMPQQIDVDAHCNKVNEHEQITKMNPNGVNHDPVTASDEAGSVLLGRLQSNFIGTEFQIFTPRMRKRPRRKPDPHNLPSSSFSPSDDEFDYDSGMSSDNNNNTDNNSSRRRFGRLSRRRNNHANNPANTEIPNGSVNSDSSPTPNRSFKRTKSCSDLPPPQSRLPRPNRRAIANTPENQEPVLCEEEDGVITYTANLLGSRPRIMDVCIPKVSSDGVAGAVWKVHLDSFDDTEDYRMLSSLRQLQQLHEHQDQNGGAGEANQDTNLDSAANAATEDFGLLALQNRPPWWNIELGSFVLNFGGRVSVASVKNFQLCDRNDQDRIMLQFGRIQGRHSFTMDFQHPLTAVQAFSIAISSLQSKISFG
jgi:hypothetical protein